MDSRNVLYTRVRSKRGRIEKKGEGARANNRKNYKLINHVEGVVPRRGIYTQRKNELYRR